jgi:hypothetical protein
MNTIRVYTDRMFFRDDNVGKGSYDEYTATKWAIQGDNVLLIVGDDTGMHRETLVASYNRDAWQVVKFHTEETP